VCKNLTAVDLNWNLNLVSSKYKVRVAKSNLNLQYCHHKFLYDVL